MVALPPGLTDQSDVASEREDDVVMLWQELTGHVLDTDQRSQFLSRAETASLATMSHERLRRAAATVPGRSSARPNILKLRLWLRQARSEQEPPGGSGRSGTEPAPFGSRDIHAPPSDTDLHRRIGPVRRYGEDT
jgi:hypothetical protein